MQNAFNSKKYNDINDEMIGVLKKYNINGKGAFKDETGFEFIKNKEVGVVKNLKEIMIKEGQKIFKR